MNSVYLGSSSDPTPVFRHEAPDAFNWPEGAVMAVTFKRKRFNHMSEAHVGKFPQTEFYGADGWPLDLPEERKADLSDLMKVEFQVYPSGWRTWSEWGWRSARLFPANFKRARVQSAFIRAIAPVAGKLRHS